MFTYITLITNSKSKKASETHDRLTAYLKSKEIDFITYKYGQDNPLGPSNNSGQAFDLVIAIGGDGTMLRAAHIAHPLDIPLLGINRGNLGFLADIPADNMEQYLTPIFAGQFIEDQRTLLDVSVVRQGKQVFTSSALNDAVLHRWNITRLVEFETYVDGNFLHKQRADGMIVSSPTGSTAYALSGGGPILHPTLDALVLVPICPHSLTNQPIVIADNSTIKIIVSTLKNGQARLTCDGDIEVDLIQEDHVFIKKDNKKVKLIHPQDHNHFHILRTKLRWNTEVC